MCTGVVGLGCWERAGGRSSHRSHLSPACGVSSYCISWPRRRTVWWPLWRTISLQRPRPLWPCVWPAPAQETSLPRNSRSWSRSSPARGNNTSYLRLDSWLKFIDHMFKTEYWLGITGSLATHPSSWSPRALSVLYWVSSTERLCGTW